MNATPVAGYGRYSQITIVRYESGTVDSRGRDRTERFYMLVDKNNQRVGRTFQYLRNARRQAARLVREDVSFR